MWSEAVEKYVHTMIEHCASFCATASSQPCRKVSIFSLSKELVENVYIDHFKLGNIGLFHAMDLTSRYFSAYVVPDDTINSAVMAFESCCVSQC